VARWIWLFLSWFRPGYCRVASLSNSLKCFNTFRFPIARVPQRVAPIKEPVADVALSTICLSAYRSDALCGSAYPHWSGMPKPERGSAGGQPAGLHQYPRCKGYFCFFAAKLCLSSEHSHRRHLLGSGRSLVSAKGKESRAVISGGTHRLVCRFLSAAACCRLSAALSLPAAGKGGIKTRRYYRDGRSWFVDCGGSHRAGPQSRSARPTEHGGSIQRVGAEMECLAGLVGTDLVMIALSLGE
jgi:hypothetical protein